MTRSSEAPLFLNKQQWLLCVRSGHDITVVRSFSFHLQSILSGLHSHHEAMLGCGLNNGLDSTDDDEFHRRRQWNNHRDWHGCDSEKEHTEVHVEWWSIWQTMSRKRVLIESGIQVAESTWNRISTPERAKWTHMVRREKERYTTHFYSHADHLGHAHVDDWFQVYLCRQDHSAIEIHSQVDIPIGI